MSARFTKSRSAPVPTTALIGFVVLLMFYYRPRSLHFICLFSPTDMNFHIITSLTFTNVALRVVCHRMSAVGTSCMGTERASATQATCRNWKPETGKQNLEGKSYFMKNEPNLSRRIFTEQTSTQ